MKYLKVFVTIISILIVLSSCDAINNLFNSDENNTGGSSIIGQWLESNAVISLILTTRSDQQATNFLNSTGEIAVTGDYNTKLTLMVKIPEDEETEAMLIVANTMGFMGFTDTSYMLGLDPTMTNTEGALMVQVNDETGFSDNLTNPTTDYSFNGLTLTVNNQTLQNSDNLTSATLNGTIAMQQVNITANTPTILSFQSDQFYEFGQTVTTFSADSTFSSSEDSGVGDSTGTWQIVGDTLKITTTQEVEDPNTAELTLVDTTLTFGYVNTGNQFIISQGFDICEGLPAQGTEEEIGCNDIFKIIEQLFDLDEGSISNVELTYQLFFDRIADGQAAKVSSNSKKLWKNSMHQIVKQYFVDYERFFH